MLSVSNNSILNTTYYRQVAEKTTDSTHCQQGQPISGIPATHLKTLSNYAIQENLIYGIRPISPLATSLIEAGYPTKPLSIKGKSADWGPQAGFICVDQNFSKLVGQPERVEKYNALISKNIENGGAVSVPLVIAYDRLKELVGLKCLEPFQPTGNPLVLTAFSPTNQSYQFDAILNPNGAYRIEIAGKPIYVLSQPEIHEPFVPDYDLLLVAPHIGDYGTLDTVVPSERNDVKLGTANQRLLKLADDIHRALDRDEQHKLIHHGSDVNNESSELTDNFPVTLFLPKVIGKYGEITVLESAEALAEFIQAAKNEDYQVPINERWQGMQNIRRAFYEETRYKIAQYYRKFLL
ncbi:anthrax toxin-like adenylyl cyclase domain-containing protein [Arsenophonus apicola]|uniref:Anthrax toxin-like adenylyl cyclase domain-containing protein n=1 Tax=Arsenophonus apicola TaxID=2879119 RepID=A0ABY8P4W6_9GAMM|nr:anthrax toxin-like adenylyl cyclase domain-containing protein [Arsenophonus apicola]WGO84224.1 anthrax toxin-like adenylyl cyclase domain-containing protein [Arsenophonus apicola]